MREAEIFPELEKQKWGQKPVAQVPAGKRETSGRGAIFSSQYIFRAWAPESDRAGSNYSTATYWLGHCRQVIQLSETVL